MDNQEVQEVNATEINSMQNNSGNNETDWKSYCAIASTVLGVLNLCSWFLPICGCPMNILAIVLGIIGITSEKKVFAYVGIGLSALSFIATVINSITGILMAANN